MPFAPPSTRAQFAFLHPLRVRWAETDPQGIVFNANYFMYFDVAVTEYLRGLATPSPASFGNPDEEMFVVNATADFLGSAAFDDEIEVGVRAARLGRTSATMRYAIFRGEELLVDGAMTYVNAPRTAKKSAPLPQSFIDKVEAFEVTPPE